MYFYYVGSGANLAEFSLLTRFDVIEFHRLLRKVYPIQKHPKFKADLIGTNNYYTLYGPSEKNTTDWSVCGWKNFLERCPNEILQLNLDKIFNFVKSKELNPLNDCNEMRNFYYEISLTRSYLEETNDYSCFTGINFWRLMEYYQMFSPVTCKLYLQFYFLKKKLYKC